MAIPKKCMFYREYERLSIGRGIGYCDLDSERSWCEGGVQYCEKPELLKKYQWEMKKREENSGWEKGRKRPFSEGQGN